MDWGVFGFAFFAGSLVGSLAIKLISDRYDKEIESINNDYINGLKSIIDDAAKEINELSGYKTKYQHLVGELDRLREVYDTPVPFTLVESQKGLSFSQGELKKLLRDEEGGI